MKKILFAVLFMLLPAMAMAQDYTLSLSTSNAENIFSQIWNVEKVNIQQGIINWLNSHGFSSPGADYYPDGPNTANPTLSFSSGSNGSINVSVPTCTVFHVHALLAGILVSADVQISASGTLEMGANNNLIANNMTGTAALTNLNGWANVGLTVYSAWEKYVENTGVSTTFSASLNQMQIALPTTADPYGMNYVSLNYDGSDIVVNMNSSIPSLNISVSGSGTTSPAPGTYYGSSNMVVRAVVTSLPLATWVENGNAIGGQNPVTVSMSGNQNLIAVFVGGGNEKGLLTQLNAIPKEFAMSPNYPNPFNPTTIINYQMPKDGHVTLTVYDALGRRVATLVDGFEDAGYHQVTLNGSGLSSGIYFYRIDIQADGGKYFVSTRKALLMK